MNKQILRIAPSPTGKLHLGTLRTAYFNWLAFKQNKNNVLILRIDDTDLSRSKEEFITPIYDSLIDLGLNVTYSFKQSDNFLRYLEVATSLIERGIAVIDGSCIRLKQEPNEELCGWEDSITGLKIANLDIASYASTQVLIKSDGSPAYNFASVVDDIDHKVTWIIRGVDHISNTYKQVLLFNLLNADIPKFSHVGLLCHNSGKKLSKRDSDEIDISEIDNEALLNYLLRLGWSPTKDNKSMDLIDRERAINLFLTSGNLKANNAKIDLQKLSWYDKKYKNKSI